MPNSQKICIIGSGLTALTIAYLLSKFRLQIDIVGQDLNKKKIRPTKLALSKNSLDQLCLYGLKDIKKKSNVITSKPLHLRGLVESVAAIFFFLVQTWFSVEKDLRKLFTNMFIFRVRHDCLLLWNSIN